MCCQIVPSRRMCGARGVGNRLQPRSTTSAAGSGGAAQRGGANSVRGLQEQLVQQHISARDLEAASRSLKLREQLLWAAVDSSSAYASALLQQLQQAQGPAASSSSSWCTTLGLPPQPGNSLHQAAAQHRRQDGASSSSSCSLLLAAAMPHDPVEQLLAGSGMEAGSSTYTSQLLARADPGRVAALQAEPVQRLCMTLTSLTMQLSLMLQTNSPLLAGGTLDAKVRHCSSCCCPAHRRWHRHAVSSCWLAHTCTVAALLRPHVCRWMPTWSCCSC